MCLPKSGRLDLKLDSMLTSILRFYEKFLKKIIDQYSFC